MSAPSSTMRPACAIADTGSTKRPPSENESGVMLRIPITAGRPNARRRRNRSGCRASCDVTALMTLRYAAATTCQGASIGDFQRQPLGILDPARDRLLRRQEVHELALGVGIAHRLGQALGVAMLELSHRVHAGGADQHRVVVSDALDAHTVGAVGPCQQDLLVNAYPCGEFLASLGALRDLEQACRRADSHPFQQPGLLGPDTVNMRDGIRHETLPKPGCR